MNRPLCRKFPYIAKNSKNQKRVEYITVQSLVDRELELKFHILEYTPVEYVKAKTYGMADPTRAVSGQERCVRVERNRSTGDMREYWVNKTKWKRHLDKISYKKWQSNK
jgi:hypothetical protein